MDFGNKEEVGKLIKKIIKGDRKSQRLLYETFYGKMLGVCYRYANDADEAQDFAQEGFIRVFEKLKGFKNTGSLEGWIRRIIVNNAIDRVRKKKNIVYDNEDETIFSNLEDEDYDLVEQKLADKMKAELLLELIQKLSPAYRTVFNLYVLENFSHKEIAEALGISIGTSKSNYAKAKMRLKQLFNEYSYKLDE